MITNYWTREAVAAPMHISFEKPVLIIQGCNDKGEVISETRIFKNHSTSSRGMREDVDKALAFLNEFQQVPK